MSGVEIASYSVYESDGRPRQKTGIQSDVLQNAKAYQLLRTAYIMAVFSPVCLLGQYILTNTGKTRIHMYSVVDVSIISLIFWRLLTIRFRL